MDCCGDRLDGAKVSLRARGQIMESELNFHI